MANTYRYPLITWEWMLEEIPTTDPFFPILFCFTVLSIGKNSANNQNNKEILLQSPVNKAGCCNNIPNKWGRAHTGDYSTSTTHQYPRNVFVVWRSKSQTVKLRAGVQIPVEANFFSAFLSSSCIYAKFHINIPASYWWYSGQESQTVRLRARVQNPVEANFFSVSS